MKVLAKACPASLPSPSWKHGFGVVMQAFTRSVVTEHAEFCHLSTFQTSESCDKSDVDYANIFAVVRDLAYFPSLRVLARSSDCNG